MEQVQHVGDSCFQKATAKGEPVFCLRAQDRTAGEVLSYWIVLNEPVLGVDHPKIVEARKIAERMAAWPTRRQAD